MNNEFDVVVIGAGPAGAIAASKLMKDGFSVKILEKLQFPRFVIGESLLPLCMDYLDELGFLPAVVDQQFQVKTGVCFYHEHKKCDFLFENQYTKGWTYTYQVKRADFDLTLANVAIEQGADLEYNATVTAVKTSATKQAVSYTNEAGEALTIDCRFVIDASGYGRVLPQLFDLEVPVSTPPRGAIFAHVDDTKRTDKAGRNIFVHAFNNNTAWMWSIPFSDGSTSVGIVGEVPYIEECDENNGAKFREMIENFPGLEGRYTNNDLKFEPRKIVNYAVSVKQLYGEGYILCGNSTEFLDPIFSSGVTLAVSSGYKAAAIVADHLKGKEVDWDADYGDVLKKGIDVFRSYVLGWYDGTLGKIFFGENQNETIKQQICSVLAGYIWDDSNPFVRKHKTMLKTVAHVATM
ncbi:MAG: tryptophan 7-halogenase [Fluviicola sp.]|nr:tryptophan 7-halogenase [Fluviicola sp.]